jgi:hypothetical protein
MSCLTGTKSDLQLYEVNDIHHQINVVEFKRKLKKDHRPCKRRYVGRNIKKVDTVPFRDGM